MKKKKVNSKPIKKTSWSEKNPISSICLKFFTLAAIIFIGVYYSESKNYFSPSNNNNHTLSSESISNYLYGRIKAPQ